MDLVDVPPNFESLDWPWDGNPSSNWEIDVPDEEAVFIVGGWGCTMQSPDE